MQDINRLLKITFHRMLIHHPPAKKLAILRHPYLPIILKINKSAIWTSMAIFVIVL